MTLWDGALLCLVGYIAVVAMVRLMIARRNASLTEFRNEKLQQHRSQRQQRQQADEKPTKDAA